MAALPPRVRRFLQCAYAIAVVITKTVLLLGLPVLMIWLIVLGPPQPHDLLRLVGAG